MLSSLPPPPDRALRPLLSKSTTVVTLVQCRLGGRVAVTDAVGGQRTPAQSEACRPAAGGPLSLHGQHGAAPARRRAAAWTADRRPAEAVAGGGTKHPPLTTTSMRPGTTTTGVTREVPLVAAAHRPPVGRPRLSQHTTLAT